LAVFAGILGLLHYFLDNKCRNPVEIKSTSLFYIFLLAIAVYAFNISFTKSIYYAADVTWPVIVISLSAIFIYLYSSFLFENSPNFNWKILIGIMFTVVGLGIISMYSNE
jgi:drug/metabolite transporter (DMT)-like permease